MTEEIDFNQLLTQFNLNQSHQLKSKTDYRDICSRCQQPTLCVDDGVIVCWQCRCEEGELIDDNAEWRNYSCDDHRIIDPTRCGTSNNPLLVESSYGTTIGVTHNQFYARLKQLNNWQSMPSHERSLKLVFDRLTQNGLQNGLTNNIIEFSHQLFAEVSQQQTYLGETRLSRGDNRNGLIAACLFYACKEYDVSRSPAEIGKICDVEVSDVTYGINLFHQLMKNNSIIDVNKCITKYSDFIDRYCSNLCIDREMTAEILTLGRKVEEKKFLTRNTPQAIACGCIYFITTMYHLGITKSQIAGKCGISVPTITKSYERLLPHTKELI